MIGLTHEGERVRAGWAKVSNKKPGQKPGFCTDLVKLWFGYCWPCCTSIPAIEPRMAVSACMFFIL